MYLYLYVNIYKVFATRVALSKPNYIQIAKTDPSPNPSKRLPRIGFDLRFLLRFDYI